MVYNFDEVIDRSSNYAAKYDEREKNFGTSDIIPLWIADMDFPVAEPIKDAIIKRAEQGIFGYTSRPDSYFEAFCNWQKKRNNWEVDKELISHCTGVVPSLSSIVHEFTEKGDKVLIQTPVYPEFYDVAEVWHREIIESPLEEKNGVYSVNLIDFEEKLKQGPKLFILCNPHNPVGKVWTREELDAMAKLCAKYNVMIVSDEIHSDLMLWGNKHTPTASISEDAKKRTITCTSCSKTFNLAGLQASFVIFPNKEMKKVFDTFWKNLEMHRNNCFSVVAVEAGYRYGEEWLEQLIAYIEQNINFVIDYCSERIPKIKPNRPDATYLMWLDCRNLNLNDDDLSEFMIKKAGLGLSAGKSFSRNLSGYMRLNVACPRPILEKALKQLEQAVNSLNNN